MKPGEPERKEAFLALMVLVAAVYLYFPNTTSGFFTPNEISRIYLTQAIVEEGSFRIDQAVERHGESIDMAFFDGHYYSDKAIGVSLLAVPAYAALYALSAGGLTGRDLIPMCRAVVVTLPAILFVAWLLRLFTSFGALGRVLVLGLALGTSFFPFTLSFYGHTLLAILLFLVYRRLTEAPYDFQGRAGHLAVTGVLCGAAALMDYTGAVFVAFAGLFLLWKSRSVVAVLWLAAGALPFVAILLFYNTTCFGHPLDLAYNHMLMENDQANRGTGFFGIGLPRPEALWGLTLGLGRGLFVYSPFLLLLLPALRTLGRPWRWEARDVLAASSVLAYFWLNTSLIDWQGGWTLGPRYLLPIYPFALVLILRGAERSSEETRRRYLLFATATVAWSGLFHLAGVGTWLHSPFEPLRFPVPETATWFLAHGVAGENLGLGMGLEGPWSLVPAVLVFAAALGVALLTGPREARLRVGLAAAAGVAALVVVFYLTYVTMGDEQVARASSLAELVARSQYHSGT